MQSTPLIRRLLGPNIDPAAVQSLIVISQTSHNDWDWTDTFDTYYDGQSIAYPTNVKEVFDAAFPWIQQDTNPPNLYSICEVAFLRRYYDDPRTPRSYFDPATLARLRISGGALTSPSNLQPHAESYFRDFLCGRLFTAAKLGLVSRDVWMPDDFGHDPQLPMTLEAMGMRSAGFSRLPGGADQWGNEPSAPGSPVALLRQKKALDFQWTGDDGSTIRAHWLQGADGKGGYAQGLNIIQGGGADSIATCYNADQRYSPTPFSYVPISSDMLVPSPKLTGIVARWNANPPLPGVYCAIATFREYQDLLEESGAQLPAFRNGRRGMDFIPTPYLIGCNATRPEIKTLHFRTVNALLAAETFAAALKLLTGPFGTQTNLTGQWDYLVPSNHHAYITGCSTHDVTDEEQLPRLRKSYQEATATLEEVLELLAADIDWPLRDLPALAIFNPCGFPRRHEVVALDRAPASVQSVNGFPVQRGAGGELLFQASAPSMGWSVAAASSAPPSQPLPETVSVTGTRMGNRYVIASIDPNTGDLVGLADATLGLGSMLAGASNRIFFLRDGRDAFAYSFEPSVADEAWDTDRGSFDSLRMDGRIVSNTVQVLEKGPLRASIEASTEYAIGAETQTVRRIYTLVAGERLLRMKTVTAAPVDHSTMVSFTFGAPADLVAYGTPTHWATETPSVSWPVWNGWRGPAFKAAHNYFMPRYRVPGDPSGNTFYTNAAFFHLGMRPWAAWGNEVISTLVRNPGTTGIYYDSPGVTDGGVHEIEYAVRVGNVSPAEFTPLLESLAFQRPLLARPLTGQGKLPQTFSLVSASTADLAVAIVTAAKLGAATAAQAQEMQKAGLQQATEDDLVFRLYVPTPAIGGTIDVVLGKTGPRTPLVSRATALEEVIGKENIDGRNGFSVPAPRCLNTYRVFYFS